MSGGVAPPPVEGAWARFERLDRRRVEGSYAALLAVLREAAPTFNLDPSAVTLAAEVVALAPGLDAERRAALTLLVLTTLVDAGQGCTRTPVTMSHLQARFLGLLSTVAWFEGEPGGAVATRLAGVASTALTRLDTGEMGSDGMGGIIGCHADDFRPLVRVDGWLYHHRMLRAERVLAERLAARVAEPVEAKAALDATDEGAVTLTAAQRAAVERALVAPLTLISGGPGTGKTSIVVALLRALVRTGVAPDAIALAAPTGKAAWRMGSAIRAGLARSMAEVETPSPADAALAAAMPEPMTLHRLLGYSPSADRFRRHAGDPLDAAVVIVDECSMIDVFLMERLAAAVRSGARLVLLGDADQLPSVAAGAVFRDALEALDAARLVESFRMRADDPAGRAVLTVARRLNAGLGVAGLRAPLPGGEAVWVERRGPGELVGAGVEHLAVDGVGRKAFLEHWFRRRVRGGPSALWAETWPVREGRVEGEAAARLMPLFAWLESARILCLTRAYDAGAARTNERLHAFAAQAAGKPADLRFLAGEPVMMLRNDYDRGLFNGDQGVVLWVEGEGGRAQKAAVFPDLEGLVVHPLATLEAQLEHAYAMTVHKAQGSEYERVAILLPDEDLPLLSRELLYTGITRCRRGVVLVGDAARVAYAASHPVTRFSGLAERLRGARRDALEPAEGDGVSPGGHFEEVDR